MPQPGGDIPPTNTPLSTPSDSPSARSPRAQAQSPKDKVSTLTKRCYNATRRVNRNARKSLRQHARLDSANGTERKRRLAQVAHDRHTVGKNKADAERKRAKHNTTAHKLEEVTPNLDVSTLSAMRVPAIDLQIRWHRVFDPKVPRAKDLPTRKEAKLLILREAVERYNHGEARQSESAGVEQTKGRPVGMDSWATSRRDGDWEMDGPDCDSELNAPDRDDGMSE